jgi:hypothetical protein
MDQLFPRLLLPPELAYGFFGRFARCEYALKRAGFARSRSGSVEPNWDDFAIAIDGQLGLISDQGRTRSVTPSCARIARRSCGTIEATVAAPSQGGRGRGGDLDGGGGRGHAAVSR